MLQPAAGALAGLLQSGYFMRRRKQLQVGSRPCACRLGYLHYPPFPNYATATNRIVPPVQATSADMQQLAAADGQQAHTQAVLAQRCAELEQEVARLRLQLDDRQAEAAELAAAQVEAAVARHLEAALPAAAAAAAERAVARWAAEALPPLLQPMQEAVAATAELAASMASEAGSIAGNVAHLAKRCDQLELTEEVQEQRLRAVEGSSGGGNTGRATSVTAGALAVLQEQVYSLQAGHSQLDEAVQGMRQQAAGASGGASQRQQEEQEEQQEALGEELKGVRQQLAAVADQQAQQAASNESVVQSSALEFCWVGLWAMLGGPCPPTSCKPSQKRTGAALWIASHPTTHQHI